MNTFWRWWIGGLVEVVIVALAGSLLGPDIGGGFGYQWGYASALIGPVALCVLSLSIALWARERGLYRADDEPESAENAHPGRAHTRRPVARRPGQGRSRGARGQ